MKLIQLNLWQGRLLKNAIKLFETEQPDIICLQEVLSSRIEEGGFLDINSLETLQKNGLSHYYFSPRFSFDIMHSQALYGNCILSRLPMKNQQTRFTAGEFVEDIVITKNNHNMANAQLAVLDINGRPLNILNHHGYHQPNPDGNQTTIEGLRKVADWINGLRGPVILAGDLNVRPASPAMQSLNRLMRNLTAENSIPSTLNDFAAVNDVPCDYIMVSQGVKVQRFEVLDELVSDHKALVLEFDI